MPERRKLPIGLLVIAPVLVAFGVYAFVDPTEVRDPAADATATANAQRTASSELRTQVASGPTAAPAATSEPTAEPTSVARRGAMGPGAWVRVNAGEGDCLNARNQPSLHDDYVIVQMCLPHGFEGYLTGMPQEADGHWWWFLAGAGWVAEDYLVHVADVDLRTRTVPELSGSGRIAFVRGGNDIWIMNADGSDQRLLVPGSTDQYPIELSWSPDGSKIAYTVTRWEPEKATADVYIVDVETGLATTFGDTFGAQWSPDSARIGVVDQPELGGIGGGATGIPAVIDLATGARTPLSPDRFYQQDPPSFNHDGTMLLLTRHPQGDTGERPAILVVDLHGNEIDRITAPHTGFFARPQWSPVDDRIAFHESDGQTPRYVVYDIYRRQRLASIDVPRASEKIGGSCGSADMWLTEWSRDGSKLHYSFSTGDTGANGIWTWDIASGRQTIVPAINAGAPSAADGVFVFSSWAREGYIFAGISTGGFPTLITDGHSPAITTVR